MEKFDEDNTPFSSSEDKEIKKSGSIILELYEDDPFYDEKKALLLNKGFSPREEVFLRDHPDSPDFISNTLRRMVLVARIINMDEVEVYFSEDNLSSFEDCYTPKNELLALHSILKLVNTSHSDATQPKSVLENLCKAVVDMIHDLGNKNNVETMILGDHPCDRENFLLEWNERKGLSTKLQIANVKGAGRGAIVKEDLEIGDTVLEISLSLIISEEVMHNSDMYHILKQIDGISSETMLLLWSMKEKHNENSEFKLYFDTLPEEFHTGLSFSLEALMALDGTLLFAEITQAKEHLHAEYDALFPVLCNAYPEIFPPILYTWEQYLWACELWYSNSMKIKFPDRKLRTCLVPIAGFLNHSLFPHVLHYGKIDSITNTLKFRLSRPCCAGQECFLSYGSHSSSHLITFYGFLPQENNPHDVIPLDLEDAEDDSEKGGAGSNSTTHMVRGTWLSSNHNIFHYGLPSPLLNYFRRIQNPQLHTKTLLQENLEAEIKILEDLIFIFKNMMDNLGDADENDRNNTNWDIKLAIRYKDIQSSIISSIVISCDAGVKLLKDQLAQFRGGGPSRLDA